jgi:hypothetical protein
MKHIYACSANSSLAGGSSHTHPNPPGDRNYLGHCIPQEQLLRICTEFGERCYDTCLVGQLLQVIPEGGADTKVSCVSISRKHS